MLNLIEKLKNKELLGAIWAVGSIFLAIGVAVGGFVDISYNQSMLVQGLFATVGMVIGYLLFNKEAKV